MLLLALFGFAVELLDGEPGRGSVIRLALFEQPQVPAVVVIGTWLLEASGLTALFLLAQGRCGAWWLDGLVAGWLGWIFRGPLLVITIVVAARQPQQPWWTLAFGWWVLYSICGLSLAVLARREERAAAGSATEGTPEAPTSRGALQESPEPALPGLAAAPTPSPEIAAAPGTEAESLPESPAEESRERSEGAPGAAAEGSEPAAGRPDPGEPAAVRPAEET